jgi:hypothetical protein
MCSISASTIVILAPERFAVLIIIIVKISSLERRSVGDERKDLVGLIIFTELDVKRGFLRWLSAEHWVRRVGRVRIVGFATFGTSRCFSIPHAISFLLLSITRAKVILESVKSCL